MNIIYSLILTLIIELTISFALGIKKCDLLRILIINILTNVPLNILVSLLNNYIDYNIIYYVMVPLLEIVVVFIESNYYKKLDNTVISNLKLSILLNSFSYGYGIILTLLLSIHFV